MTVDETTPIHEIRITGGAGEMEAAAIAAVIRHVVAEQRRSSSRPRIRERLPDWQRAGRAPEHEPPRAPAAALSRRAAEGG